jgi:hypothetical protein
VLVRPAATSSPAALPHPCTLLTVKDAEEVLGPGAQVTRGSESTFEAAQIIAKKVAGAL